MMTGVQEMNRIHRVFIVLMVVITAVMPTYSVLAELQATPVVEPTPTEEVDDSTTGEGQESNANSMPGGSVHATPAPQALPAITPSESSSFPIPRTGSLEDCRQSAPIIAAGGTITVECTLELSVLLSVAPSAQMSRLDLSDGFTAQITIEFNSDTEILHHGSNADSVTKDSVLLGAITTLEFPVIIQIEAPITASSGDTFATTFHSCRSGSRSDGCSLLNPDRGTASVEVTVSSFDLIQSDHYSLECSETLVEINAPDQARVSTCTLFVNESIAPRQIRVSKISASITAGQGWSVELADFAGVHLVSVPGEYELPNPLHLIANGQYQFQVRLTPHGCIAEGYSPHVEVGVELTPLLDDEVDGDSITAAPPSVVIANYDAPDVSQHASVIAAPDSVYVDYSLDQLTTINDEALLTVEFVVVGCSEWFGYVEMEPFGTDKPNGDRVVPQVTGAKTQSVVAEPSDRTTISAPEIGAIGIDPTYVLGGTAPAEKVVVLQTINLEYTIPANTPVGTYTSTITVTVSDAP